MFCFRRTALLALTAGLLILPAATSTADIARRKFERLDAAKLPAGSRVDLSGPELNAWAADEARIYAPGATRNIRLVLGTGRATGSMLIDFVKLHQATTGESAGWLMKNLFSGERQVTVTARFQSRNHKGRVDVERVEVSGVPVEGATLDFLINNWLRPTFPDVKINEWFDLGLRIDRFTVSPEVVSVFIGK